MVRAKALEQTGGRFSANKNGQALLSTYSATTGPTSLSNWLATTYSNLVGNLAGAIGAQVGAYFIRAKNAATAGSNYNTFVQMFGTALSVWVTGLGFNATSASYGFHQGFGFLGLGDIYYNVGTNGASFGVANNTYMKVSDLLAYFNGIAATVVGAEHLREKAPESRDRVEHSIPVLLDFIADFANRDNSAVRKSSCDGKRNSQ